MLALCAVAAAASGCAAAKKDNEVVRGKSATFERKVGAYLTAAADRDCTRDVELSTENVDALLTKAAFSADRELEITASDATIEKASLSWRSADGITTVSIDDGFVLTAKVSVRAAASSSTPGRKSVYLRLPLLAELEGLSLCTAPRNAVSSLTASYVSPDTFAMDVVVLESEPSVGTTVFRFGVAILALVALLAAIGLGIWFNRDRYTM